MYPPITPPPPTAPKGYHARNSFALLFCSAFLIAFGASKGLDVLVPILLGVALLWVIGLIFTVIALARGRVVGGIFLLLGWLAFLPFWALSGLGYGFQVSARQPQQTAAADGSVWTRWAHEVEVAVRRAAAQRAAVQNAAAQPAAPAAATPNPVNRAAQEFAAAVEDSKRRAIRRHPDLAVAGSEFNRIFVAEYNRLTSQHDAALLLVTWPETLADECARKNVRSARR